MSIVADEGASVRVIVNNSSPSKVLSFNIMMSKSWDGIKALVTGVKMTCRVSLGVKSAALAPPRRVGG